MAREVVSELVSVVVLDTTQAKREAAAHAERLRGIKAAQDQVTRADKEAAAAASKLRGEMLALRREEVAGTGEKKALAQRSRELKLRMAEQAESTRALRDQQRALREEQRATQASMRETARVVRDAAKAEAEAIRLLSRAEAQAHRERQNFRRLQQSGGQINDLTESISTSRARLARLQGPFGGLRTRAHDAAASFRENWRDRADSAISGGVRALPGTALSAGRTLVTGALGAGVGLAGAAGAIASRGATFEGLRTSLETVEGSAQKAAASFKLIQQFAAQTPFTVEQATTSLIKLKARGLDASLPALTAYGDTASAMGKSLDDMIEAVADATTGEFERLKEFGIKAKTEGDQVKLTFRGVTTSVHKDAGSIEKYLINLGKTNFAGGMERQSKTLAGMMSSLSDAVDSLADTAFQNGLGQALKDIVADMMGATGGADDLAKMIGKTLGDAVTGAYKYVKEFIGPIDELPGKLKSAAAFAGDLAKGIGSVIKFGADVVGALGPANTAIVGLGIAAAGALGPLGALFAAGMLLGRMAVVVSESFESIDGAAGKFIARQKQLESLDRQRIETGRLDEANARRDAANAAETASLTAATDAEGRYRAARLRQMGKSESSLTAKERAALDAEIVNRGIRRRVRGAGAGRAEAGAESARAADLLVGGAERAADAAELLRLRQARARGKLRPDDEKRLKELDKNYNLNAPGKAKKDKDDAFTAERRSEIDTLVKKAELAAADRALASGNAAGAGEAARAAGQETRKRLEAQARTGALPGEVERALLRQAGFENAQNAPPPPVIVYQQQFNISVPLTVDATVDVSGPMDDVATQIGQRIKTTLDRDILPPTVDSFRSAIRR